MDWLKGVAIGAEVSLIFWTLGLLSTFYSTVLLVGTAVVAYATDKKVPPPRFDGHVEPGWERVQEAFRRNVESGQEMGGAFAVYHEGRCVVDLWGGYSDLEAERPWQRDTLAIMYSCTKGMCGICIATLVDKSPLGHLQPETGRKVSGWTLDMSSGVLVTQNTQQIWFISRGLLDYEEPVSKVWPEFAQNGKAAITLKSLLSHQSGLIVMDSPFPLALTLEDPEKLGRFLARQKPNWTPGTGHGYHIISIGLYMDQIIRRADPKRRGVQQYFKEEIAQRFDVDYQIGLPLEQNYRCVRVQDANFGLKYLFHTKIPTLVSIFFLFVKSQIIGNNFISKLSGTNPDWMSMNNPDFRIYPIGSTHGFSTARAIAKVYGILGNGGADGNGRLLKEETVQILNTPVCSGPDKLLMMNMAWGPGSLCIPLDDDTDSPNPPKRYIFGFAGLGGQLGIADPYYRLGWGYATNYNNSLAGFIVDHRYQALQDAMFECVREQHKIE